MTFFIIKFLLKHMNAPEETEECRRVEYSLPEILAEISLINRQLMTIIFSLHLVTFSKKKLYGV